MKEFDLFREIAARLDKYGIRSYREILDMYGFSPSPPPDIVRGKRFTIRQDGNKFTVHRDGRAKFGKSLQAARNRLGLSVEEVAALANFTPSTVQRMESGGFSFSIDQAARLADVLRCDITLTPR